MTEERIDKLESKFAHQEEFLYQLNKIVVEQQERIERLERELRELRGSVESAVDAGLGRSPGDEKPPHY